jgi:hypothetical protein
MHHRISGAISILLAGFALFACTASTDETDDDDAAEVDDTAEALSGPRCAPEARGNYCGTHYRLYGKGNTRTLYRCANGKSTVKQRCKNGCMIRSGMNDTCF